MLVREEIMVNLLVDLKVYQDNFPNLESWQEVIINSISRTEKKFSDFTCKLAFRLNRFYSKSSWEMALEVKKKIEKNPLFLKLEVAKPGFINFSLQKEIKKKFLIYFHQNRLEKLKNKNPQRILIEYVSANPTGPLHIGHGRWAVIGNVLTNLLRYAGHEVEGEFYINDRGQQIKKLFQSVEATKKGEKIPPGGYPSQYFKKYMNKAQNYPSMYFKKLVGDPYILVQEIIEEQKGVLKKLGVKHDSFFSEKSLFQEKKIKEVLDNLVEKNIAYYQDGVLWFRSSKEEDDKDRVLIKSDGSYTYFAVDVVYHLDKIKRGYDLLIDILGADHHGYLSRITNAVEVISEGETSLKVLIGQNVLLKNKDKLIKMSKREGNLVTLQELIEEVPTEVIKYFFSMRSINTPLEFDVSIAKKNSLENPIYYIQYAHARICSVLENAENKNFKIADPTEIEEKIFELESVNSLVVLLMEFEKEIINISHNYEFHRLNNYLYHLAQEFHKLYNQVTFLNDKGEAEKKLSQTLLLLLSLVKKVLNRGLTLLMIEPKSKM